MKLNKIIISGLAVLTIAATSITAFAFTYNSPAEIVANLAGKPVEEVVANRYESSKTYGQIAYDEGLWEEYRDEMNESKKAFLDEKVTEGAITQEEADQYYNNMLERQEFCHGNGTGGYGMRGYGFGNGGQGRGMGFGRGRQ
ncbi:hypothetical protein [Sedimentibacter sp. MB31-C6]|uniref:hypothetical protein n=1 Tax=Sedimentibacter sp. MB31-C6 TaxID=3109366 RepID=UPI002DDCC5AB|nr:hypothetical protein [Sedimentibacter sp. MB36-C1]WSI04853.1 hypothetical protein U8307_03435 [Sedimentibacter sp. MB36-C1]